MNVLVFINIVIWSGVIAHALMITWDMMRTIGEDEEEL